MNTLKKVPFGWLARHLIPNTGTLIVLALFFLSQSVGAKPSATPAMPEATATLLNYQGTLTDKTNTPINSDVEMVFDLYHSAEGGTPFWTEAHTGTQAIEVTNGQFHVLLGSQVTIDPADLIGDLYLGVTVNGEELLPRELLVGSVVKRLIVSGQSTAMIEGNLQIGDNSWAPEFAGMDGDDLAIHGRLEQGGSGGTRVYKLGVGVDPDTSEGTLKMGSTLNMNDNDIANLDGIRLPFKLESERPWELHPPGGTR